MNNFLRISIWLREMFTSSYYYIAVVGVIGNIDMYVTHAHMVCSIMLCIIYYDNRYVVYNTIYYI